MKNLHEKKSEMSSERFLEKFLSKSKYYNKCKGNTIYQNNQKNLIKNNISDYNSINWLQKFYQKKKDTFYEKVKEDINRIKTTRNISKKILNMNNDIMFNYSNSKEKKISNNKNKKDFSNKNNFHRFRFIKKVKEELKNNTEEIEENENNKREEKIRNIKIEKIISKKLNNKNYISNKRKINNNSFTIRNKIYFKIKQFIN